MLYPVGTLDIPDIKHHFDAILKNTIILPIHGHMVKLSLYKDKGNNSVGD